MEKTNGNNKVSIKNTFKYHNIVGHSIQFESSLTDFCVWD